MLVERNNIGGLDADVGSDWHLDLTNLKAAIDHVRRVQTGKVLFCMGDLFNALQGEDTSPEINAFLQEVSKVYDQVIYTPGNHDLRGRDNPWDSFDVPENVKFPHSTSPITTTINGVKILAANIFYDLNFINPSLVGLTMEEVKHQYSLTNDGRHFLSGDTTIFKQMTETAATALTEEIDVVATHTLPHPSLVVFRVPEMTTRIAELARQTGLNFICEPQEDYRRSTYFQTDSNTYRRYWNTKSFVMGSNLLDHPNANPKDGLTVVHGHHHRNDKGPRIINNKRTGIVTHQPFNYNQIRDRENQNPQNWM